MANKASIKFDFLDDMREALRRLPEELHEDAFGIMDNVSELALHDITFAYPEKTGNLKNGMTKEVRTGLFKTVTVIKNKAPHAWIYEHGTQARHFVGRDKLGRHYLIGDRGAAKPGNVFIPRMIRWRARFYERIADLLEQHGLLVTGRAA